MTEINVNTFTGGLDTDTDISIIPSDRYLEAHNFRLVSFTGNSNIVLETVRGNVDLNLDLTSIINNSSITIVGVITLRESLVLFLSDNILPTTESNSYIVKVDLNNYNEIVATTLLYTDESFTYPNKLAFQSAYKIKGVGRFENNNSHKIYWTDGYNVLRFCNINDPELATYTIDKFEVLPNINLIGTNIRFNKFVSGNLKAGKIQYAYQLYNKYGAETVFSPLSGLIPLAESSEKTTASGTFKGSKIETNTGKGIVCTISNVDTSFDMIKIVSLFYDSSNATPVIKIISEKEINESTVSFTDTGSFISELTIEEFSILNTNTFVCKDIDTKNDILFCSNITETNFDVDFDARAYRFSSANNSKILDSYISKDDFKYLSITSGSSISTYVWTEYTWDGSASTATGNTYTTAAIPEDYDCINLYNNTNLDDAYTGGGSRNSAYDCMYTSNGTTIGGSGLYVSYMISTVNIVLDKKCETPSENIRELTTTENSNNYAKAQTVSEWVTFMRDEIYRIGVVFFNDKGQSSFVKWIGDIRMPNRNIHNISYMSEVTENVYVTFGKPLLLTVTVTTDGTAAEGLGWKIVRVKRDIKDSTILSQGVITHTVLSNSKYRSPFELSSLPKSTGFYSSEYADGGYSLNLVSFISPELLYTKEDIPIDTNKYFKSECVYQVDKILVDRATGAVVLYPTTDGSFTDSTILIEKLILETDADGNRINISDIEYVGYEDFPENTKYNLTGVSYDYINLATANTEFVGPYGTSSHYINGAGCSKVIATLDTYDITNFTTGLNESEVVIVNYKQDIFESQYGGITYEDRLLNEYIQASITINQNAEPAYVIGDTYISYFDVCRSYWIGDETNYFKDGHRGQAVSYIPIESKINLEFTHGFLYHREWNNREVYLMRELPGLYLSSGSETSLTQNEKAYDYNNVYSLDNNIIKYYCKPITAEYTNNYDCRIKYSNKKLNGELIDSWSKFNVNNYLDVDSTYGTVNNIKTFNNRLFFWQTHSTGVLSVNDRSIISDNNPGALVLGDGGVLDRYTYSSNKIGNTNKFGIIPTDRSLYWIDNTTKEIIKLTDSIEIISKTKNIQSYLNTLDITNVIGVYDRTYNEVLFSVLSDFSLVDCTINYLDTGVGDLVYYDLILPEFDYTYNFNITNGSELKVIEYDRYVAFNSWYNASLSTYIESSSLEVGASASNQYCYLDYFGYQLDYEGQKLDVGDIVEFKFTVTALNSNESKFKLRFYYFPGGEVISNEVTLTSGSNTAIFTINKEWDEEVYLQLVSTAATSSNVILSNGTMTKYSRGTIRNFRYDTDLSKYVIRFQTTIDDLLDTGSADIEFVNDTYIGNTIVYNDMLQVFTGFYDFIPTMYIERPSNYLTSSTLTDLYLHNTGNYGEYYKDLYNTSSVRESKILIPVNKDFYYTKVFDNLRFSTTSIDDDGINRFYDSTGVYDTFDKLRVYNDYQNSDFVVLDTINTDISRREREWTLSLPRNAVSLSETTSPNIFDSTNLNTTRLFRERIRGKYIILELVYNNLEGYKFNCPYVITKYRKSKR